MRVRFQIPMPLPDTPWNCVTLMCLRLEAKGHPRLETLELIIMGLNSEIVLIPKEKLAAVLAILESDDAAVPTETPAVDADTTTEHQDKKSLSDDPWQGLLGDES